MVEQKKVKRRVGRYFLALAVGSFAALSLLWVMQFLIATGQAAITEVFDARFVDFVRVKKEEIVETKEDKPEKPPEPEDAPPDLPQPDLGSDLDSAVSVAPPKPSANLGVDSDLGDFSLTEGDFIPLVIVRAIYPRRAQSRGLEGYCDLVLTVTPVGTTTDVVAVSCTSSLFERASIQAAQKFKYKPRVVDGNPISSPGVQYRMTFKIEE